MCAYAYICIVNDDVTYAYDDVTYAYDDVCMCVYMYSKRRHESIVNVTKGYAPTSLVYKKQKLVYKHMCAYAYVCIVRDTTKAW